MTTWEAFQDSLSAVTVSGTTQGSAVDLEAVQNGYAALVWATVHTGDNFSWNWQGSVDSSNWYDVGGDYSTNVGANGTIGPQVLVGSTPARYLRINVVTSAGTGPVVSAIAAGEAT